MALVLVLAISNCLAVSTKWEKAAGGEPATSDSPTYLLQGGLWWVDGRFQRRQLYVVDGFFTRHRPPRVDEVIRLDGRFVVPPFAEAHSHSFESTYNLEMIHRKHLEQGIFYVQIANNIAQRAEPVRAWLEAPGRIDVAYSNGGITASGGHPIRLWERVILPRAFPEKDPRWLRDRAYFVVDDAEDLQEVWPRILEGEPDFIKTFLLYSEEHRARLEDPRFEGLRGLDPELLPTIVDRAHGHGLRVGAHVETAHDFRVAVAAGVDTILHLPGHQIPASRRPEEFLLRPADAREARRSGVVVVTTAAVANRHLRELDRLRTMRETMAHNLRLLHEHGVTIAVGSDRYELTALDEIMTLRSLGVFDDPTLLTLWCETSRTIFPQRKIGRLLPGYEASLLVLDRNPAEDLANVRSLRFALHRGHPIHLDRR
ncbi:MAG: hypothetical protein MI919_08030 [Holophagales bacterium]|nr:hypothetical protein [Holophagales bacterium]